MNRRKKVRRGIPARINEPLAKASASFVNVVSRFYEDDVLINKRKFRTSNVVDEVKSFLYCDGLTPYSFLQHLLKYAALLNPILSAISTCPNRFCFSKKIDFLRRIARMRN